MTQPNRDSTIGAVIDERDMLRKALQEIADLCHSETRQRLLGIAQAALDATDPFSPINFQDTDNDLTPDEAGQPINSNEQGGAG